MGTGGSTGLAEVGVLYPMLIVCFFSRWGGDVSSMMDTVVFVKLMVILDGVAGYGLSTLCG